MSKQNNELIELTNETISSMIYEIRGQKVMLDFDLAKIYGYETSRLNQQVKRNIDKFPDDFMFQIAKEELDSIMMSQIVISRWGGLRKLPYAFTEQGIYMLMTVLKGELAVKQSKALIRLFKQMKDYITSSNSLADINELLRLSNQVNQNKIDIREVKNQLRVVMDNFIDPSTYKHFLILNGERIEAVMAYRQIYSLAKETIYIIDDYISVETLMMLRGVSPSIKIIIFSDNVARDYLDDKIFEEFKKEYGFDIKLVKNNNIFHDRYIVIDYGLPNEMLYHAGASSKNAGDKITTIRKIPEIEAYYSLINELLNNID